jgi:ornithine carbamoyltransferase
MKSLISLKDLNRQDIYDIFEISEDIEKRTDYYSTSLRNRYGISFFPEAGVRTRISFDKAVHEMGGRLLNLSSEALNKKEYVGDVAKYISNWGDFFIIRHSSQALIEEFGRNTDAAIINAMTSEEHPCEILSDLYAFYKDNMNDLERLNFVFVGLKGNICNSWCIASQLLGFPLKHICPEGLESEYIDSVNVEHDLKKGLEHADIIITDSWPQKYLEKIDMEKYQITLSRVNEYCKKGVIVNPCPPFFRNEELSADIIDSEYFTGYTFKYNLVTVQKAIIYKCIFS